MTGSTLAELHAHARAALEEAGIAEASLDARLLTEQATGTTRKELVLTPTMNFAEEVRGRLAEMLARRAAGEPVHRIIGWREFYGLPLSLSPETLEPRPDTEALVDLVLPSVRAHAAVSSKCRILDLGTGTGAIGLALLAGEPLATAVLTDLSSEALATAGRNAEALGLLARVTLAESDWFANIAGRFDVIVSNPPYIRSSDIGLLQREVREFDPARALDGGADGLDAYRAIASRAAEHLEPGGVVAVEIGAGQLADVSTIFEAAGLALEAVKRDLGGHERALLFTVAGATQKTLGTTEECG